MTFDFGAIAREYDDYYSKPVGRMVDRLEKAAVDRLLPEANPGETLIEPGSGTGHWSAHFAARGYRVTGVEISPEMVDVACEKRIEGATFHVGDALNLEFPDDSFDVGAAITVLEVVSDVGAAVAELARVVKPRGRLIFGVLHEDSYIGRRRKREPDSTYAHLRFFTVDELGDLLRPCGKVTIRQCLFAPLVSEAVEKAEKIEEMGLKRGWRHGNFLVAEVRL